VCVGCCLFWALIHICCKCNIFKFLNLFCAPRVKDLGGLQWDSHLHLNYWSFHLKTKSWWIYKRKFLCHYLVNMDLSPKQEGGGWGGWIWCAIGGGFLLYWFMCVENIVVNVNMLVHKSLKIHFTFKITTFHINILTNHMYSDI
jgi:hypothetical protein